ncbi:MAG: hypothetical protein GY811_25655 [Myxococcales bacterium]|nr:hypothetical protein [Myxococcales bacterium]
MSWASIATSKAERGVLDLERRAPRRGGAPRCAAVGRGALALGRGEQGDTDLAHQTESDAESSEMATLPTFLQDSPEHGAGNASASSAESSESAAFFLWLARALHCRRFTVGVTPPRPLSWPPRRRRPRWAAMPPSHARIP